MVQVNEQQKLVRLRNAIGLSKVLAYHRGPGYLIVTDPGGPGLEWFEIAATAILGDEPEASGVMVFALFSHWAEPDRLYRLEGGCVESPPPSLSVAGVASLFRLNGLCDRVRHWRFHARAKVRADWFRDEAGEAVLLMEC